MECRARPAEQLFQIGIDLAEQQPVIDRAGADAAANIREHLAGVVEGDGDARLLQPVAQAAPGAGERAAVPKIVGLVGRGGWARREQHGRERQPADRQIRSQVGAHPA